MEPINHLEEHAPKIRLSAEAKGRIREKLMAHMALHPVAPLSPYQRLFIRSPYLGHLRKSVVAATVVLLVGVGGVSTYAAAGSLPGDPFYPIKTHVIEPVQGLLAVTPEAKAKFAISLAETRASEAAQLASRDKLTPEQSQAVQASFDESLANAKISIKNLSKDHPDAAHILEDSLTTELDVHEAALTLSATTSSSTNALEAHAFAAHINHKVHEDTGDQATSTPEDGSQQGEVRGAHDWPSDSENSAPAPVVATTTEDASGAGEQPAPRSEKGLLHTLDF